MNQIKQYAEIYIAADLNPIPIGAGKIPALKSGHTYLTEKHTNIDAFTGVQKIALACGLVSDNLLCIDFDQKQGNDVSQIFNDFIRSDAFRAIENNCSVIRTPSGGFHIVIKTEEPVPTKKLATFADGTAMIETRGTGSYFLTYPSDGYIYLQGLAIENIERNSAQDVNRLLSYAQSFSRAEIKTTTSEGRLWPDKWDESKPDGKFNNEGENEAKTLLCENGWNYIETRRDGIEYWTRPGKSVDDGISATWGRFHNCFYVFSSSVPEFVSGRGYTPFDIFCKYKHNGNWKDAKDDLRRRYGMDVVEQIDYEEERKQIDFPIDIFPVFLRNYIIEAKRTLQFTPDYFAVSIMSAIASVNGNKYKVRVKNGWDAQSIFWFAIVGEPGVMKTHPLTTALKPIRKIDDASFDRYQAELYEYNSMDVKDKKGYPKPFFRQILVQDSTLEALHKMHVLNPRGILMYKDELIGFMQDMNKYRNGSDEAFWLESFNNGSITINRAGADTMKLNNICINLIGTIQPDVLADVVSKQGENGLIDRFLFTESQSKINRFSLESIDEDYNAWYNKLMQDVHAAFSYYKDSDTIYLQLDADQLKFMQKIDEKLCKIQEDDELSHMRNYVNKLKTYYPRFVLMCALLEKFDENDVKVTLKCMENAEKLCDYFLNSAMNVFADTSKKTDINEISAKIKGLGTSEKIVELYKKGVKKADIARQLKVSRANVTQVLTKKGIK